MFGDPLTLEECQKLISDLKHCTTPFQCAHGRPSVAPMTQLSQLSIEGTAAPRKLNFSQIDCHRSSQNS